MRREWGRGARRGRWERRSRGSIGTTREQLATATASMKGKWVEKSTALHGIRTEKHRAMPPKAPQGGRNDRRSANIRSYVRYGDPFITYLL